jgi:hypothetical protein
MLYLGAIVPDLGWRYAKRHRAKFSSLYRLAVNDPTRSGRNIVMDDWVTKSPTGHEPFDKPPAIALSDPRFRFWVSVPFDADIIRGLF